MAWIISRHLHPLRLRDFGAAKIKRLRQRHVVRWFFIVLRLRVARAHAHDKLSGWNQQHFYAGGFVFHAPWQTRGGYARKKVGVGYNFGVWTLFEYIGPCKFGLGRGGLRGCIWRSHNGRSLRGCSCINGFVGASQRKCCRVSHGEYQEHPKKFYVSHPVQNTLLVRFTRAANKSFVYAEVVTFQVWNKNQKLNQSDYNAEIGALTNVWSK